MIPKEIKKYFEIKDISFRVSKFEEYMLQDIFRFDDSAKQKLNRDVTTDLTDEIKLYKKQKRNIRYTLKGETRDGKSLIGLKIISIIMEYDSKQFNDNIVKTVCGNQIEYRKKLMGAKFGDSFLIDENFFQRAGLGSNVEADQLKDYNSIIAKKNISAIFINPEKFLNVGATLGITPHGRDSKNWLTKCLIYKMKNGVPNLIGYAIVDIGSLFHNNGCYIYRIIGGCNNVNQIKQKDIPKDLIKHSFCIPDKTKFKDSDIICPYYDSCIHGLCGYEHKKDSWIVKEMSGGLDERTLERFKISVHLIIELFSGYNKETNHITLRAKNSKDLKNRVRLKVHKFSNVKMGIGEYDEFIEIIKTNCDVTMLVESLKEIKDKTLIDKIKNLDVDLSLYVDEFMKDSKKNKKP